MDEYEERIAAINELQEMMDKDLAGELSVRVASLEDIPSLLRIEAMAWEPDLRATLEQIRERILDDHTTTYVAYSNKGVIGALYTQRIVSVDDLLAGNFASQRSLRDSAGSIVQLMAIGVDQTVHGNVGGALRDHALNVAAQSDDVRDVVAMTRCSGWDLSHGRYEEWVHDVKDPTIFFHRSGGAQVLRVVEGYRPEDRRNGGRAVCISYQEKLEFMRTGSSTTVEVS